jgi:hypothetical protein
LADTTIGNLVSKLPLVTIGENVKEMELRSRSIDPFLAGLFDDPDNSVVSTMFVQALTTKL